MTTVRFYVLFIIMAICAVLSGLYGSASAEQLKALLGYAKQLQNPEFNQALQDALSDGKITRVECYRLNGMAKRLLLIEWQKQVESRIKTTTDTSK